ncbi:MAG: DUF1232 domain-containing protein [Crocinitomicaceae bacterium]|nr:DUF1232 domain-containing protein [Crocinitomicaceae bacterium]
MNKSNAFDQYKEELIRDCIGGDDIPEIIKEVPRIFDTLLGLLEDRDLSNENRLMVLAGVGYYFIPNDLYPEETLGQIGYVDDVLLCLEIFNQISNTPLGMTLLERHWKLKIEIQSTLDSLFESLRSKYSEQYIDVVNYVGIFDDDLEIPID